MKTVSFGNLTDYDAKVQQLEQRKKYAEALRAQGQQQLPGGQMVGNQFVATNPLNHLANALRQYSGAREMADVQAGERALNERKQADLAEYLKSMPGAKTETTKQLVGDRPGAGSFEDVTTTTMPTAEDYMQWSMRGLQFGPQVAQLSGNMANQAQMREFQNKQLEAQTMERQAAREQRAQELIMRLEDGRLGREERATLQRELAQMQMDGRRELAQFTAGLAAANRQAPAPTLTTVMRDGKPVVIDARNDRVIGEAPPNAGKKGGQLPSSALKLQQESLDAINAASGSAADIDALVGQIESGSLKLGPVENVKSKARNAVGMSSPESQNFATFEASLENMRNASLRLNKGVQTEGDAEREWNALIANINDPKVVKKRLQEIKKINERAIALRKMDVDVIRQNYGLDPLDMSAREGVAPAVDDAGAGKRRRFNPNTGKLEDM